MASSVFAGAQPLGDETLDYGLMLYGKGMYAEAREVFERLGPGVLTEGYATLCAAELKAADYEDVASDYFFNYPWSPLLTQLNWRLALNYFDEGHYEMAAAGFGQLGTEDVKPKEIPALEYKRAYSQRRAGDAASAYAGFMRVLELPVSSYTAPARFELAYLHYEKQEFAQAAAFYEAAGKDERFKVICDYYLIECHFMLKDYDYVKQNAPEVIKGMSSERKNHLARLVSEAYLVGGDTRTAKQYYDQLPEGARKDRADWFYAGSLLYATGDYKAAVENFSSMTDRTDSLGQIANYQMAYSYIRLKDKVSAHTAFKDASQLNWDRSIQEDAFFNYAKLSYDLGSDQKPFEEYLDKFPDSGKKEQIYAYMALACLYAHDYQGAIDAYGKIEELDREQKLNYMKANYLRASQLIKGASWRAAIPCLEAAGSYSSPRNPLGQLSRYWLAEANFRIGDYPRARELWVALYNLSALNTRQEGNMLSYNIAYTYFKEENTDLAQRWFTRYLSSRDGSCRRDAMLRSADCLFLRSKYKEAADAYIAVDDSFHSAVDAYPLYQAGLAYGLSGDRNSKLSALSRVELMHDDAAWRPEAMLEFGRTLLEAGNTLKAEIIFTRLASSATEAAMTAKALMGLGLVKTNTRRYDEALVHYKKVVSDNKGTDLATDALAAIEAIYRQKQEPEKYLDYIESLGGNLAGSEETREQMLFDAAQQIYLSGNLDKALSSLSAYLEKYPSGSNTAAASFYMAECHRQRGEKEKACDLYDAVLEAGNSSFGELAALNLAKLSYDLQRYDKSFAAYSVLSRIAVFEANRQAAAVGMMLSCYAGKDYAQAIPLADAVLASSASSQAEKTRAEYVKAKSLMSTSRRDEALKIFRKLSASPKTAEGAEAAYILIQDSYDRGDFETCRNRAYAFSESGSPQTYWVAKAFITLGDSFADEEDFKQARATFESIRDGYPAGMDDDVSDSVKMRLARLDEMGV